MYVCMCEHELVCCVSMYSRNMPWLHHTCTHTSTFTQKRTRSPALSILSAMHHNTTGRKAHLLEQRLLLCFWFVRHLVVTAAHGASPQANTPRKNTPSRQWQSTRTQQAPTTLFVFVVKSACQAAHASGRMLVCVRDVWGKIRAPRRARKRKWWWVLVERAGGVHTSANVSRARRCVCVTCGCVVCMS